MAVLKEKYAAFTGRGLEEVVKELHLLEAAYARILKISVVSAEQSLVELRAAMDADDGLKALKIAHDLKGMFGNLRVEPLVAVAVAMERQMQLGARGDLVRPYVVELEAKLEGLKGVFEQEGA